MSKKVWLTTVTIARFQNRINFAAHQEHNSKLSDDIHALTYSPLPTFENQMGQVPIVRIVKLNCTGGGHVGGVECPTVNSTVPWPRRVMWQGALHNAHYSDASPCCPRDWERYNYNTGDVTNQFTVPRRFRDTIWQMHRAGLCESPLKWQSISYIEETRYK